MVASLGDAFSLQDKNEFAERNIIVGAVLKTFSNHTHPPKEKRFIIAGIKGNSVGVVYINTNPNVPPKLLPFLKPLAHAGREAYLTWDCYVDCNTLYEWSLDQLKQMVCISTEIFLGHISHEDFALINALVKTTPNADYKTLEKYGIVGNN